MFECVYTKRKTQKVKKWCDGFVEKKGSSIRLFNGDMKSIDLCTCFTILEDLNIDTPTYLIFTDFLDELMGKDTGSCGHTDVPTNEYNNGSCNDENYGREMSRKPSENRVSRDHDAYDRCTSSDTADASKKTKTEPKLSGRSKSDILGMFKTLE